MTRTRILDRILSIGSLRVAALSETHLTCRDFRPGGFASATKSPALLFVDDGTGLAIIDMSGGKVSREDAERLCPGAIAEFEANDED